MRAAVTTGADDRRMALPSDLVALDSSLSTAAARTLIDAASLMIAGDGGLRFEPWRTLWTSSVEGSGMTYLLSHAKPIESVTSVADSAGTAYTDYTVGSNGRGILDRLERDDGWGKSFQVGIGTSNVEWAESELPEWAIVWRLGWLMPGQVSTWAAATAYKTSPASVSYDDPATSAAYARGAWVRATNPSVSLRFECTTAGTSGATQPAAFTATATAAGDTITDGTVTWTARSAFELPADLCRAALRLALYLYRTEDPTFGGQIKSESEGGARTEYVPSGISLSGMPMDIAATVESYR